jgi:hypothetical protein
MLVNYRAELHTEWEAKGADEGFVADDNGDRRCHGERERADHAKLETGSHLGHLVPLLARSCNTIKKLSAKVLYMNDTRRNSLIESLQLAKKKTDGPCMRVILFCQTLKRDKIMCSLFKQNQSPC